MNRLLSLSIDEFATIIVPLALKQPGLTFFFDKNVRQLDRERDGRSKNISMWRPRAHLALILVIIRIQG